MGNSSGKIFISHASKDKDFVDRLVSDLAAHAIPVWYDKLDVRLGDSIPGKINSGISEAKYFLIVLSPAAVKSNWVLEELNAALMRQVASAGTFLIPFSSKIVTFHRCSITGVLPIFAGTMRPVWKNF